MVTSPAPQQGTTMVPPVNTTVMGVMSAKGPPPGSASPAASGQGHHPSVLVSEAVDGEHGHADQGCLGGALGVAQQCGSSVYDVGMGASEMCLF